MDQAEHIAKAIEHRDRAVDKKLLFSTRFIALKFAFNHAMRAYAQAKDEQLAMAISVAEIFDTRLDNSGKSWTESEDDQIVQLKSEGVESQVIAALMKRTPYAVATRISSLVGRKRLFISVDGRIVGSLEGKPVDGHFVGEVAR